ncbi:MAG: selenocysteine-specific translation elongation factor [Proteobacteria bacterium]|nr:selenocysteine-specific translation elongation factor [Pseudomonadota bacterium]MCP4916717.1 selenocysteine-specific translation elongation factor [Pseudomonadota bacterium]
MHDLPRAFVVGTAGHIDHGKTTLVRSLTGVDLDALPEERQRGITIALGFTPLTLPSGRIASFVDVPGHERLVRTMISGATGVDAVVLCVSAVEGVMPQTREHLAILKLLDVQHGLIALTMADLVDEDMIELATDDVRDAVEGSFLEDAPLIVTSAETRQGIDELIAAIDALPAVERSPDGPFRLPVDRTFVQKGFGSVVTGTTLSGSVSDGDDLVVLPQGDKVRVRGVQVHGEKRSQSRAGLRTALNLVGAGRDELPRGTVVASPDVPTTSILDARVHLLTDAPAIASGSRVRLLIGTAEVLAVAQVLDGDLDPGTSHLVQLRTSEPVVALPRDRFVLRRESPLVTLGGGVVLDPWAPKVRNKTAASAAAQLERLEQGDATVFLERAGLAGLAKADAATRGATGPMLGGRVFSPAAVDRLIRVVLADLDGLHAENPLVPGAPRRALYRGPAAALHAPGFDELIQTLASRDELVVDGPRVRRPDFAVVRTAAQEAQAATLFARIEAAGIEGLKREEACEGLADGEALLQLGLDADQADRVAGRLYGRGVLDRLIADVERVLDEEGDLSPGRFKELTGLARRGAIPLLEWLDARKVTRREGDTRIRA